MTTAGDVKNLNTLYDNYNSFSRDIARDGVPDIHVGFYNSPTDSTSTASCNTVRELLRLGDVVGADFSRSSRLVDLGAGMGGTGQLIAQDRDCHVTCLNIVESQNEINRARVEELGLSDRISVVSGSYDKLPEEWTSSFDVVLSTDAVLHARDKPAVAREMFRIAKPGAFLLFTDIMAGMFATAEAMVVYRKRNLVECEIMNLDQYEDMFRNVGFTVLRALDWTSYLVPWLRHMGERVEQYASTVQGKEKDYMEKRAASYVRTVGGLVLEEGQSWGVLLCHKPAEEVQSEKSEFRDIQGQTRRE